MAALSWLKNNMSEDMADKLLSTLCINALALAGFAFTSLAVFLGFYQGKPNPPTTVISCLMFASTLFFISSEIAREGHTVGEYMASETIYLVASALVFTGFIDFVLVNAWLMSTGVIWVLAAALVLFVGKLVQSGRITIRRMRQEMQKRSSG